MTELCIYQTTSTELKNDLTIPETLPCVGTIIGKTDLQSAHGGENRYESVCYRHGYKGTAGKEQDDTASTEERILQD